MGRSSCRTGTGAGTAGLFPERILRDGRPGEVTSSFLLETYTDAEVIALSDAVIAGRIGEQSPVFAKAHGDHLLDLAGRGWRVRDSAQVAVRRELDKRVDHILTP